MTTLFSTWKWNNPGRAIINFSSQPIQSALVVVQLSIITRADDVRLLSSEEFFKERVNHLLDDDDLAGYLEKGPPRR